MNIITNISAKTNPCLKWIRLSGLLVALFFFLPDQIQASHIVGGDLTYRCLGNNMYEIRMVIRRDCLFGEDDAPFDDPASIGFYDGETNELLNFVGTGGQFQIFLNNDDTLNQTFISDCTIAGSDVCVQQTLYVDTLFLPFRTTGYQIAYQRCCRNQTLANIVDPLNTGMTLVAFLSGDAQTECNSSPQFQDYPPIYICTNEEIAFDHSAIDPEGDSLVYSLCAPFSGGDSQNNMPQPPPEPPYNFVAFNPPYSLANILGGDDALEIDSETGMLSGTPETIGQFVVGICVTAFRDGERIGETRRDFQYNVRVCRDVPIPSFTATTLQCDGLGLEFVNNSVNADEFKWIFDFGNPGSAMSFLENPSYTFPSPGFYNVALIANDNDSICIDTAFLTVGVFNSELESNFEIEIPSCQNTITVEATDLSTDPTFEIVEWNWILTCGFDIQVSTEQNPTFNLLGPNDNCNICLTVTDENGCTAMSCQDFDANNVTIDFLADSLFICNGGATPLIQNGNPDYTYTWSPTTNLDLSMPHNPIASPSQTTTYSVTVTDGLCEVEGSVVVSVQQLLNLDFNLFTDCSSLTVETENLSQGMQFHWDFGDPAIESDTSLDFSPTYTYNQAGVYIVTLSSRDGCDTMLTKEITISNITEMTLDTFVSCFGESVEINPDFDVAYSYNWTPADLLDDPTKGNPIATVMDDTWFVVTITDIALPGCSIVDSVLVIRNDDFDLNLPDDTVYCDVQTIVLTAGVTGPGAGNLMFQWFDNTGPIGDNSPTILVTPEMTTEYTIVGKDSLGCMKMDNILIQVPPEFELTLPNDTVYCEIQEIMINVASDNESATYQWFDVDGNLLGMGNSIDVMPVVSTKYFVVGTDSLGCTEVDSILIQIPEDFSVVLPADTAYCDVQSIALTPMVDHTPLTIEWFELDGTFIQEGDTLIVNPNTPTTYVVVATDSLGCSKSDTITLTPTFFDLMFDAGDDQLCLGDTAMFMVTNGEPDQNLIYTWTDESGNEVMAEGDGLVSFIKVAPDVTTQYTVLVTNADVGCEEEFTFTATVFNFDPLDVILTCVPDSVIAGETIQLTVNQSPNYTYEWSSNPPLDIAPTNNPTVVATVGGPYSFSVTVTNDGGCTAVATCGSNVFDPQCNEDEIFIPSAFSPNGDGQNEVLFVRGNFILDMELHIYNRWGEEVFRSNDQNNGWDGTLGGEKLAPDVYGYYLTVGCPNDQSFFKKGDITLFR